jgi:glutamyl-tRNA synthetase/glutamyl-Q tRNA(Asp) synthetase
VPTALRCDGQPHNLRVIVPDETIHWHDLRLGDFDENPKKQCGDFPIRDRDGQWTYQFAVCVDDIDERITHVVRGEDILSSTARQIALMRMLGRETPPAYLHHPLIVDSTGKKLSKRELAHSLRQDREAGLSRETLLGRVCFKAGLAASPAPIGLANAIYLIYQIL